MKIVDNIKGYWYIFDGYQIIEEYTYTTALLGQPALRRQIVYGKDFNEPVLVKDFINNKDYYLLKDEQHSVFALYDSIATDKPSERYEYGAYGVTILSADSLGGGEYVKTYDHDSNVLTANVLQIKSDFENPFGFQGMWRDEHTGLYHTHYRIYDPAQGRWSAPLGPA